MPFDFAPIGEKDSGSQSSSAVELRPRLAGGASAMQGALNVSRVHWVRVPRVFEIDHFN